MTFEGFFKAAQCEGYPRHTFILASGSTATITDADTDLHSFDVKSKYSIDNNVCMVTLRFSRTAGAGTLLLSNTPYNYLLTGDDGTVINIPLSDSKFYYKQTSALSTWDIILIGYVKETA